MVIWKYLLILMRKFWTKVQIKKNSDEEDSSRKDYSEDDFDEEDSNEINWILPKACWLLKKFLFDT